MSDESSDLIREKFIEFVVRKNIIDKTGIEMTIDESVGTYIINTINQLFEEYENHKIWLDNKTAESFDIENFVEIIDAYLNGFNRIAHKEIIEWLVDLKKEIAQLEKIKEENSLIKNGINIECCSKQITIESEMKIDTKKKQNKTLEINDPNVKLLSEMFPDMDAQQIEKIYKKVNCNYEAAVELLLNKDAAASILFKDNDNGFENNLELTEEEKKILKEKTVKKFGFVAVNEDGSMKVASPPKTQWNSEKKLVRYFDSKVVSTKGEKYFEVKTEEDEELAKQMKKTYVNLKPAKAYRFH